jgi:hypothetical protein
LTSITFFFAGKMVGRRNPYAPSIDRINCEKGYTRDNVRIVISAINMILSDWGAEVMEHVAIRYLDQKDHIAGL